jgi:hypothetical protein
VRKTIAYKHIWLHLKTRRNERRDTERCGMREDKDEITIQT